MTQETRQGRFVDYQRFARLVSQETASSSMTSDKQYNQNHRNCHKHDVAKQTRRRDILRVADEEAVEILERVCERIAHGRHLTACWTNDLLTLFGFQRHRVKLVLAMAASHSRLTTEVSDSR